MIRYYGLYSNAHRGKVRKTQEKANPFLITEQEEPFVPSKGWAEMIRKVYEGDPLLCPSCGGQMEIISFIEDPATIDNIIRHLQAQLPGRTASTCSKYPTGTPHGSRGERGIFLNGLCNPISRSQQVETEASCWK
jgi:hypothetical protein